MKDDEEAFYLDKAIGECEAAFRNAQGLLWARISYVNQTIRVRYGISMVREQRGLWHGTGRSGSRAAHDARQGRPRLRAQLLLARWDQDPYRRSLWTDGFGERERRAGLDRRVCRASRFLALHPFARADV